MRNWMTVAAVSLCLLTGCSEKPEAKLARAEILLEKGDPNSALELAGKVAAAQPGNARALRIKARAQAQLKMLDQAIETSNMLLQRDTDPHSLSEDRRQRIDLAWRRMEYLMSQSSFTGAAGGLRQQFDNERVECLKQIAKLQEQEHTTVEPAFDRGRLGWLDLTALEVQLQNYEHAKTNGALTPGADLDARIAELKAQRDLKYADMEQQFKTVIAQEPRYKNACDLLTQALLTRQQWEDLWVLANRMAEQKDIQADTAATLVVSLGAIPEAVHPLAQRVEVGWKLQQAVDPKAHDSALWLLSSARLHLLVRDTGKALPLLDRAGKLAPKTVRYDVGWLTARCYYLNRQFDKAKEMIDPVLEKNPNRPMAQLMAGLIYREIPGHMPQAKEALKRASDLDPENEDIRQAWAKLMIDEAHGDVSEISELYRKYPTDARLIRMKLNSDLMRGRLGDYRATLEATEHLEPLTAEHLTLLVGGYRTLGEGDKAVRYARSLVEMRDDLPSNLLLAAAVLGRDDQQADAVRTMLTTLKQRFPEAPGVDQLMAELYFQRRSYDKSVKLLEGVVKQEPKNDTARIMLARCYTYLSLVDDALHQVDAVLDRDPNSAAAHELAFRIYSMTGDTEKAREHPSAIDPAHATDPVVLAQFELRQAHFDQAAQTCEQAIQNGSSDPMLRVILAKVYQEKKDPARVETELINLVELMPDSIQAYLALSRFYYDQKDIARGSLRLSELRGRNEVLARIAQGRMLASAGEYDPATDVLDPIYAPLIRNANQARLALVVADELAKFQALKHNLDAAVAVYDKMIAVGVNVAESKLRQIMLRASERVDLDASCAQLDDLLKGLKPDQDAVHTEIIRQFLTLGRMPHALDLLDQWLAQKPGQTDLLRWKGEMLLSLGRGPEAVKVYEQLVNAAPDQLAGRLRLASAHALAGDYPGAAAVLEEAGKSDAGARIVAQSELGQMFVRLGLYQQAHEVFDQLERTGKPNDPRVAYAAGEALMSLGQEDQAAQRFAQVPAYADSYAAAQVRLAEIEQHQGHPDAVKKRLENLLRDPTTVGFAAQELLRLDLAGDRYQLLFNASDDVINLDYLPRELRRSWIQVRVAAADAHGDWAAAERTLGQFAQSATDAPNAQPARIMTLIQLNRVDEARYVFVHDEAVRQSPYGPLLAAALGQTLAPPKDYRAWPTVVVALARGDAAAAKAAVPGVEITPTIYRTDLQTLLDRSDVSAPETVALSRKLALAVAAVNVGLPHMAADICRGIIKVRPSFSPAYAVLLQAVGPAAKPADVLADQAAVLKALPDSTLALYVSAQGKAAAKDYIGSAADFGRVLEREPDHYLIRSMQAKALEIGGQYDQAIAMLEKAATQPGIDHVQRGNDLAYLIAEHQPQRLEQAYQIAQGAFQEAPNMPPLLDTLGWIEHLRGNDQRAQALLAKCVCFMPGVPDIQYHLGVIYSALGQKDWARFHLSQALADNKDDPQPWVAKARELLAQANK